MNQRIDPYTGRATGPIEAPSYLQGLPTMRAQPEQQGPIGAGLSTGRREVQGLAGDVAGAVGNVTGLEGVQRAGEAYADDRFAAAAGTARQDLAVPPWESRDTPIGSWLAYETARQVPQLAAQLVAGRLVPRNASPKALERAGASLPRALGGGGAKPGMSVAQRRDALKQGQEFSRTAVGAVATGYPLGVGAMYGEAREAGEPTQGDAARALAMGLPYAALDAFQPVQLQGILRQGLKGNIVRRIATAGVVGGVAEMPQEAVQTAMELTFRPDMSGPEKMRQIVNAALTGAAVGGVIGGAGGLRRLKSIDPAAVTNEDLAASVDEGASSAPGKELTPQARAYNQMFEAGSYPAQPVDPMVRMTATDPMASEMERLQAMSRVADPRVRPEDIGQQFDPLAQLPEAAGEVRTDERPLRDVPDAELMRAYEVAQAQPDMVADERGVQALDAIRQEVEVRLAEQQAAPTQAATQQDTDAAITEMRARAKQLAGGRDTKFTRELDARNETELTARVIERLEEGADDASLMRLAEGLGVLDANGQPRDIGAEVQQAEARLQQMQTRLERTGEGAAIADAYSRRLDALRQEQTRLDAAVRLSRGEVDAVQPAQASEQGDVQGAAPAQPTAQAEAVPAAEQQVEPAVPTAAPPARSTAPVAQLAETAANVEPVGAIGEQLRNLLGMQARRDEFSEAQGQQLEQRTTQVQRAQAEPVRVQSLQRSGARANVTLSNGERVVAERRTRQGGDIEGWYGPNDEYLGSTLQDVRSSLVEQANSSGEQRPAPTEDTRVDMRGRTGPRATIRRFRTPEGSELARRAERPNDPRMAPERLKKLKTAVRRELKRMNMSDRVAVDITDRLDATLNGLYQDGAITVDALMDDVEVIGAVRHELIHALRDPEIWGKPYGLFTKQEWDTLVAAARERPDIVNFVEANYADQPTDVREEEMVAELYRTWAAGRPADSMIQRIMDKIHEAIHGMIAAFEGAGEYRSAQLLLRVANGTIGARAPAPRPRPRPRPRAPAPTTNTEAFKTWFGDSKVVDANGAPLTVYHGTNADITSFDSTKLGSATGAPSAKMGFFFAADPAVASSYADTFDPYSEVPFVKWLNKVTRGGYERLNEGLLKAVGRPSERREGGNVLPVYLSIQNPMVADFGGARYRERTYAEIISEAQENGHDGVILRNTIDAGFMAGGDAVTDIYVAFAPTQIKSVFNQGTFDPTNPYIRGMIRRAQRAWHGTQGVFDRFSLDFLGTGVGRQAYGWGLYFSSQKDMAAAYRAKMARKHGTQTFNLPDSTQYGPDRPGHAHIKGLFETYPTVTQMARDRRRSSLEENLKESRAYLQKVRRDGNLPFEEQNIQREIEALEDAISVIDTVEVAPGGTLFEVEIPNDDRLMDFDATLANQPPQVREAMMAIRPIVPDTNWVDDDAGTAVYAESEDGRTIGAIQIDPATNEYTVLFTDFRGGYVRVGTYPDADAAVDAMAAYDPPPILEGVPDQMPAYQAYQLIGEALTPRTARASDTQKAASLALAEAGVPGHRYAELGTPGDAERNYVIYDDKEITVKSRQSRKGIGAKLTSPVEQADMAANGAVTTLQNRAQQALAKMTTGDFSALSTAGRNAMLYASTLGHISDFFGGMFKSGSIKKLLDAHRTRVTLEQQMAHLSLIPYHSFERLERSDAASAEQIRFLMGMTEFNIDPRRPWRDQTWLHQDPMADKLQQHAVKAHRIYKNLEQRGKLQTYTGFLQVNEMMHFAQQAMSLYHTAMAQPGAAKLMGYDSSPMLDFMQRSDLHESPEKARAYWQGVTKELIDKATKFEMTQRGLTGSMTAQDIKMFETHTSSIKRRIATIKEQQEAMERAPYFHLGRFGDYFVAFSVRGAERTVNGKKVRTPDRKAMQLVAKELERAGIRGVSISEDTARDNVFLRFENETQMNNAFETVQMLKKRGLLSENREPQRGRRTSETDPTRAQEQIAALRDYIKSSPAFQETDDMTPEQAEKVKYARNQMEAHINAFALDLLPDTSIGKVMVHRDSVPGYSSDMVRSYAFRTQVGAHALANLSASPLLSDAFTGMKTDINDAKVDPDQDVVAMQDVMGELMTREANRPTESGHNFLDTMRAFNHAYFLGMSPSYVLVNMTQIPVLLWPELAKGHGYAKSFQAIAKVTPLALKVVKAAIQRGIGLGPRRLADSTVTDSALQRAGIGKTDREFIMRIVNTGVIDIGSASREHGRIVEDRLDSNTDLALRYASAAGFYSEMTSRLVAALATRELEGKKGLDPAQLQERVVKTVDQSMLNYSTYYVSRMSGKSGFAGPVTPLMLAFLQYSFQLTEKLFRELHTGFISKANTKAEKQQARRFLAAHLTSITALAGTLGLPMATVFARVINSMVDLLGDDEEPYDVVSSYRNMLSDVFGKEVGEIIARGAPRYFGFDISRRVGEQDILPFSRLIADRRAWDDALKDWAVDSLGSPFSMMASIAKGGSEIARGNLLDGMKEAMPVALKGPIEAYRMSERGYVDRSGTALPMEVGARDILTQALGFSTAEKAEYSEAKMAQTVRKGLLVREAANLRKNIAVAIESGDRAKAQEWLAKARSFDLTNPGYAVLPGLSSAMTSRARARALSEASGLPLGTNMRDPGAASLTDYANFQP